MSIYCTTFDLGLEHSKRCERIRRVGKKIYEQDDSKPCTCGSTPIRYRGSHIFPSDSDERAGGLDLGAIPRHLTRNGRDNGPECGWHKWLRVSMHDGDNHGAAVLTLKQVEKLRDALNAWIENASAPKSPATAPSPSSPSPPPEPSPAAPSKAQPDRL
jgi:hypothetical protein